ncbi:hypothetical protein Tco_1146612 [Tanacetum coccineum]
MTKDKILKDYWKERFSDDEDNMDRPFKTNKSKECEDLEKCREDEANAIFGAVLDKLNDDWFNGTNEEGDDLEGIIDYLEPTSYDGFTDLDNEAYKKRKSKLLGMTYRKPPPILIEKAEVTRYTVRLGESYIKVRILGIDELPMTKDNLTTVRARLMGKIDGEGKVRRKTFSQQGKGIRGHINSDSCGKKCFCLGVTALVTP